MKQENRKKKSLSLSEEKKSENLLYRFQINLDLESNH